MSLFYSDLPTATGAASITMYPLLKSILALGSPRQRLSILIFHRVLPQADPLFPNEVDAARFDQLLGLLTACFNLVTLEQGLVQLRAGTLPPRATCITFDDGYADNAEVALPILRRHGVAATFYVSTGFLDGGRMWNDTIIELVRRAPDQIDLGRAGFGVLRLDSLNSRRHAIGTLLAKLKYLPLAERHEQVELLRELVGVALPDDLMMTGTQVRQLHAAGMEIGGHTVNHPILARLAPEQARREISDGKEALEALLGAPVYSFAYPNGKPGQDYLAEHADMVRAAGFTSAVSTSWGAASPSSNFYQLPRFTPWDRNWIRFAMRLMQNMRRAGETA
ncbi:polysaccharide deacetylase family protein [Massilia yuzhufengensis]|uniref:Peptidoglycan/xylan/chitin deacetylase, PgdA/CDA1 family n=1 Tax=Massilia yuzhufengensis TaxID=1164594 RepID=A0A1I1DIN2_9BURK|nr:polysaccharide deacetylase family protein [Massilia yuzhufengensis]SFB74694.1 Peptidoglycan/xylan/chitin deacetylase, PgdA/CDA1 family [Massilia yuzhufengensis]